MPKRLKYLGAADHKITSDYPIRSFEEAMQLNGVKGLYNGYKPMEFTGSVLRKLGLIRRLAEVSGTAYIAPIMLISEQRIFPVCYFAETMCYIFDCWPAMYDQWEAFFKRHKMKLAFISARQSAERLGKRVPGLETIWMPEGIDPARYVPGKPVKDRKIDVLELGRRYDAFHAKITDHCATRGYDHRFERAKGQWVFSTEPEFYTGIADSKISVCFPSSTTHPARSGDVETLTLRYLESIACRNIILGHSPSELNDLFGYNPCIEADLSDPAGQIDQILGNLDSYEELLNRNLKRLHEVGTWKVRVGQILAKLRERGYQW